MSDPQDDVAAVARIDLVPTILATVCRATGMGFAAIARVTDERWIACSVRDEIDFGLRAGDELKLETTICHEIRQSGEGVVIPDVWADPAFRDHHTPARYGFRSYISMPIILSDGRFFGTLCAIDPEPRPLEDPHIVELFRMFARIVGSQLDQSDRLAAAETRISTQHQDAALREQFIAVLGHDLRNPLANILAGITLLKRSALPPRAEAILATMAGSGDRMAKMIDNILDFARGRLGGGLTLQKQPTAIAPLIARVVGEFRHANPDRMFDCACDEAIVVDCDPGRIEQLLSNLVGNAVSHGAADQPIEVRGAVADATLTLCVINGGDPIPEATRAMLFHPFSRGEVAQGQIGLGLGLFIASEIAAAHDGHLSVTSDAEATRFSLSLPIA